MMDNISSALYISLKVACISTVINSFIAIVIAYILSFYKFKGKELIDTFFTLPLILPPSVLGYYLLVLLGKNGPFSFIFEYFNINLIFTVKGAIIASCVVTLPLILKPARAAFDDLNKDYINIAKMANLSAIGILVRIIIPLSAKAIICGIMLAFARAMGEFGATLMVAGSIAGQTQTLSTAIYEAILVGDDKTALILVCITTAVCMSILLLVKYITKRD